MKQFVDRLFNNFYFVAAFIIGVILLLVSLIHNSWTNGNNEKDYDIVCIHGHEYYRSSSGTKGYLGIKLTDAGIPIKCS